MATTAKTLADALLAARKAMKDPRMSGDNPHFRSKFVPRDEVLDVVIPALSAEGVFLTQGAFGDRMVTSAHKGAESVVLGEYPLPQQSDPQKFLAACTYASRGSLMLAFALAGDADDDGNTAAEPEPEPEPQKASADWLAKIREARTTLGIDDDTYGEQLAHFGVTSDADLSAEDAAKLLAAYNGRLAEKSA
jgi:hypothetical protein